MKTLSTLSALCVLGVAGTAFGQTVNLSVEGNTTAAPGETVTVSVFAEISGLAANGALGGYGVDIDVTNGASAVTAVSAATTNPDLNLGVLQGTAAADGLTRAVGGRLANVFNLNPGIDSSTRVLLFTTDVTIAGDAADSTVVTVDASAADNGGIVLYPDRDAGANITVPSEAGTTLTSAPLDITVSAPIACPGDADGNLIVDLDDFSVLAVQFGTAGPEADFDGSGTVDLDDFSVLAVNFGASCI